MSTEIKGLKEIIDKLNALPPKLENKIVRAAVRKGANQIRDLARSKVSVDTGNIKKSIVTVGHKENGKIAVKVTIRQRKSKNAKRVFYAKFLEFGTSKMNAKPFLRPALDESEDKVLDAVIDDIKNGIDEVNK